ncbi:MAG: hypothetical protein EHM64_01860 [Ignavibacteriae bacterium]|nr:MAG: hypothetical protein EHM64_01860 [Ignavibacteriota bacterium]
MELSQKDRDRIYAEESAKLQIQNKFKEEEKAKKRKKYWYIILGVFAFIVIANLFSDSGTQSKDSLRTNAYTMAKHFIKEQLTSPASADFASMSESNISTKDGVTFTISSYVDSQNSFGAVIRTNFVVKIRYIESTNKWRLEDISTY